MKAIISKGQQDFSVQMMHIHKNKNGQSLAEFILTFGIVCLIIILFAKLALNYTKGYMIHYANYMTSRSYMVQDNNSANPETADGAAFTTAVNDVYKKLYGQIRLSDVVALKPGRVDNPVFVGIKTEIEEDFSFSPMVGGEGKVKLISESFLGREPTISECAIGTCIGVREVSGDSCGAGGTASLTTLWDNGC